MDRVAEIKAMPKGTVLSDLKEMPGFEEWRASPITNELLARLEVKRTDFLGELDTLVPPAAGPGYTVSLTMEGCEYRSRLQGLLEGLHLVDKAIR